MFYFLDKKLLCVCGYEFHGRGNSWWCWKSLGGVDSTWLVSRVAMAVCLVQMEGPQAVVTGNVDYYAVAETS